MRAVNTYSGNPTGAIAITGSSKSMSWSPPMDAQDEMNDLLTNQYADNNRHLIGSIHGYGCIHMMDEYGSAGQKEMDAWHIFGDPSLMLRTDNPKNISVIHASQIPSNSNSFQIHVYNTEYASCTLSYRGRVIGNNYTDVDGTCCIDFVSSVDGIKEIYLVITAFNKYPYFSIINISSSSNISNIEFQSGWNLISIPLQTGWMASDILANISDCNMVSWYDTVNQTYRTATGSGYNFPIECGRGYFVYTSSLCNCTIYGKHCESSSIPLLSGWNMIGWYHNYDILASDLMETISGCTMISWYDTVNDTYRTATKDGGYDFLITRGTGVFVYVIVPTVWIEDR